MNDTIELRKVAIECIDVLNMQNKCINIHSPRTLCNEFCGQKMTSHPPYVHINEEITKAFWKARKHNDE